MADQFDKNGFGPTTIIGEYGVRMKFVQAPPIKWCPASQLCHVHVLDWPGCECNFHAGHAGPHKCTVCEREWEG